MTGGIALRSASSRPPWPLICPQAKRCRGDLADLRSVLYGLDAILRLHTTQEDETYLSLGDTAEEPALSAGAG